MEISIQDIKKTPATDLLAKLDSRRSLLLDMKLKNQRGQLPKSHELKLVRLNIARILTVLSHTNHN